MSISQDAAFNLAKAQISQSQELMKSDAATKYRKKKQLDRGGVGNGYYEIQARSVNGQPPGSVVKADGEIRTINDMIDYWYGFVPEFYAKQRQGMQKNSVVGGQGGVSDPSPGWRNAIFGSEVFNTLNFEVNAFSVLENRAWTKSGERVIEDFGHTGFGEGAAPENSEIPDPEHPELAQFEQQAKTVAHSFDVSQVKQLLSETEDDDLDDPFDWLRRYYGEGTQHQTGMGEHPKKINEQLLTAAENVDDSSYGEEEAMLSLDQIISSGEEVAGTSVTADQAEIYGFDRTNGEYESNVIHNEDSNRIFTIDLLDDAIRRVKDASGKNPVQDDNFLFLTGHDTFQRIEEEVGGKERLEAQRAQVGLNGVETTPGDDVGITVQSYKDVPIFESQDVPTGTDGISRVYLLDSSTMFIKTLLPTQFYSSGTEVNEDPFSINQLSNRGLYVTIGELTCVSPDSQAKVRDLQ